MYKIFSLNLNIRQNMGTKRNAQFQVLFINREELKNEKILFCICFLPCLSSSTFLAFL